MNLNKDLQEICKQFFTDNGFDISRIKDGEFLIAHLGYLHRLLPIKPRRVLFSKNFRCPESYKEGFEKFIETVQSGGNLAPYMTKKLQEIYNDPLFNDWKIHHFHLGVNLDRADKHFMERTDDLLFALVDGNNFYCLEIAPHAHSSFLNKNLLEIINTNWPELFGAHKLNNATFKPENLSEEQIKTLREKNVNVAHNLSDGSAVFHFGGGLTGAGTSVTCVMRANKIHNHLEGIQMFLESDAQTASVKNYLASEGRIFRDQTDIQLVEYNDNHVVVADYNNKYCCVVFWHPRAEGQNSPEFGLHFARGIKPSKRL